MKIIALVGLTGSGKTKAAKVFKEHDFEYVRFGQAVLDEVLRQGLEVNEENERRIREELRQKHGMAAMAKILVPVFDSLLKKEMKIIADGLYSWEEYTLLKDKYGDKLIILALYAGPETRYKRLTNRRYDPKTDKKAIYRAYTPEIARARDYAQIENLHQAGPIAMADYTIVNEGSLEKFKAEVEAFIKTVSN